jgi:hypothetical protein
LYGQSVLLASGKLGAHLTLGTQRSGDGLQLTTCLRPLSLQELSRTFLEINDLHKPVQKNREMVRNRKPREIHERVIDFA